ncbi:MAG TPA: IS66 family transposase zinc-finger binding domain-containing protein, partial [Gemmatimonadaceae bacterium]|nr:IS66 family transposase zinc-finger binding domain-containing protein [Gemmatimonadaceae bacterium]
MSSATKSTEEKGATERLALSCFALERRVAELEAALGNERRSQAATAAELEAARAVVRQREAAYARLENQHMELTDTHARVVQERDQLLKRFLGRKSEKDRSGSGQLTLPLGPAEEGKNEAPVKPETKTDEPEAAPEGGANTPVSPSGEKKRRGKGGRRKLSPSLERRREVIEPPEHLRICACGKHKVQIGEETSEKLERVPATLYVRLTVRPILACPDACESSVVCAPAPLSRITHGLAGESVHGWALTSKFGDHLPLNRLSGILAREGCLVSTSTLGD